MSRPHTAGHGHSHGLIDPSILRSRAGLRAVGLSLLVLLLTTVAQIFVFFSTNSVALLADLIHNAGDALTAIFVSAAVAAVAVAERLFNPSPIDHLGALALAGLFGFVGNESPRRSACAPAGAWRARR